MKYVVLALAVLSSLCILAPVSADIFELALPSAAGEYLHNTSVTRTFDFGRSFASINALSVRLSGQTTAG